MLLCNANILKITNIVKFIYKYCKFLSFLHEFLTKFHCFLSNQYPFHLGYCISQYAITSKNLAFLGYLRLLSRANLRNMSFNEQNIVEHFIIHQLTGVNLNSVEGHVVKEEAVEYDTVKWKYVQADLLQRDNTEVFVEKELKEALCRLNPDIAANPDRA